MKSDQTTMTKHAPHTLPPVVINLFFALGLTSALCVRALMAVKEFQPELFRTVWYAGIIGYVFFFSYRYGISRKRKKTIRDYNLITKVEKGEVLSAGDRDALVYLLSSLQKSRESLNYLFIFVTSALAIILDLAL